MLNIFSKLKRNIIIASWIMEVNSLEKEEEEEGDLTIN